MGFAVFLIVVGGIGLLFFLASLPSGKQSDRRKPDVPPTMSFTVTGRTRPAPRRPPTARSGAAFEPEAVTVNLGSICSLTGKTIAECHCDRCASKRNGG